MITMELKNKKMLLPTDTQTKYDKLARSIIEELNKCNFEFEDLKIQFDSKIDANVEYRYISSITGSNFYLGFESKLVNLVTSSKQITKVTLMDIIMPNKIVTIAPNSYVHLYDYIGDNWQSIENALLRNEEEHAISTAFKLYQYLANKSIKDEFQRYNLVRSNKSFLPGYDCVFDEEWNKSESPYPDTEIECPLANEVSDWLYREVFLKLRKFNYRAKQGVNYTL